MWGGGRQERQEQERKFFVDSLLVRIHFIIEMVWWTGLAPWEFGFPFPGSLISTFLVLRINPKAESEPPGRRMGGA